MLLTAVRSVLTDYDCADMEALLTVVMVSVSSVSWLGCASSILSGILVCILVTWVVALLDLILLFEIICCLRDGKKHTEWRSIRMSGSRGREGALTRA